MIPARIKLYPSLNNATCRLYLSYKAVSHKYWLWLTKATSNKSDFWRCMIMSMSLSLLVVKFLANEIALERSEEILWWMGKTCRCPTRRTNAFACQVCWWTNSLHLMCFSFGWALSFFWFSTWYFREFVYWLFRVRFLRDLWGGTWGGWRSCLYGLIA